jgi:hypothetical protein
VVVDVGLVVGGVVMGTGGVGIQRPLQVIVWVQKEPAGHAEAPTMQVCVKGFVGVGVVVVVFVVAVVLTFLAPTERARDKVRSKLMGFMLIFWELYWELGPILRSVAKLHHLCEAQGQFIVF